jgi:hypothetical protein
MSSDPPPFRAFEAFGYAMACVGRLEVILRIILAERKARDLRTVDPARKQTEHDRFTHCVLFKSTFGALVQQVSDQHKLPSDLRDLLTIATTSRDYLVHHFWHLYLGNLDTEAGIDMIAAECNVSAQYFLDTAEAVRLATGVNMEQYDAFVASNAQAKIDAHPLSDLIRGD